jgi:excisionase family DNA binding protein
MIPLENQMSKNVATEVPCVSGTIYRSVEELAADLGISRQSAYAGLRQGAIPSRRIGKRYIVARTAIQEWLKQVGERHDERS